MSRPTPLPISAFPYITDITTRWMDNDVYGHINNVTYYSFFDTVVANWLIESGVLDIAASPVVGLVVDTQCSYFSSIAYPDKVRAGLRVAHVGTSSVRYEIGIFRNNDTTAAAQGHFVHVYVERKSNRPAPLGEKHKQALEGLKA
ncbi:MAG: acyl-CoA thioesterase [Pseudolabrys sp.]|nr:acyl-CoA thioesterase [Pseudolabrys sp.]